MSQRGSEPSQPASERVVALHRATLSAVDFRKARFDRFELAGCKFDRCDFRGMRLGRRFAPLFAALPRSVFHGCYFDGADLRRFHFGQSRFERCTFDDALLARCVVDDAEFLECRFAGQLDGVVFRGRPTAPRPLDPPRERNEFRGNDFRDAELGVVAFVAGIDMDAQRWPADEMHIRVDRFHRRLAKARAEILMWYPRDRTPALAMIAELATRWRDQEVVVARRWTKRGAAPVRVQARVWALIERVRP